MAVVFIELKLLKKLLDDQSTKICGNSLPRHQLCNDWSPHADKQLRILYDIQFSQDSAVQRTGSPASLPPPCRLACLIDCLQVTGTY